MTAAPCGSVSLLAGNVSSGIEPNFAHRSTRLIRIDDSVSHDIEVQSAISRRRGFEGVNECIPTAFEISPRAHVAMLAAVQSVVDGGVSKTVNFPESLSFEEFSSVYDDAFDKGCKALSVYRPNSFRGAVLKQIEQKKEDGY